MKKFRKDEKPNINLILGGAPGMGASPRSMDPTGMAAPSRSMPPMSVMPPSGGLSRPPGMKKGGSTDEYPPRYMSFSETGKPAGMKPVQKKMAHGGGTHKKSVNTRFATSVNMARGGGIESRGKTKCKLC